MHYCHDVCHETRGAGACIHRSMCVIAFICAGVNMKLQIALSEGGLMGQVRGVASATDTKILKIPVVVTS